MVNQLSFNVSLQNFARKLRIVEGGVLGARLQHVPMHDPWLLGIKDDDVCRSPRFQAASGEA